ncbi:MAG: PhzF family phenazine biosynthesis protein [Candidatus Eremiobacteraeota bacterium]|nr:PhzF family phenazine biosynthesis protein [Candidatus Eremiobacteraeota bacterium]
MRTLKFHQVDVFTQRSLFGNPLAVYLDADEIKTELMQRIAREMNLSETTFVQRSNDPECAFRVRIFTPGTELPFAGHPTVGTAFVLTRLGKLPNDEFFFQMASNVLVKREQEMFWLSPPPLEVSDVEEVADLAGALNLAADRCLGVKFVRGNLQFLCVVVKSPGDVDAVQPDRSRLAALDHDYSAHDVLVFSYDDERAYSRFLPNPAHGIVEDPATGSSVAPLCLTLKACGRLARSTSRLTIEQGAKMGRQSFLYARFTQSNETLRDIEVGGTAVHNFESVLNV